MIFDVSKILLNSELLQNELILILNTELLIYIPSQLMQPLGVT